jgi:hypothetical protein
MKRTVKMLKHAIKKKQNVVTEDANVDMTLFHQHVLIKYTNSVETLKENVTKNTLKDALLFG